MLRAVLCAAAIFNLAACGSTRMSTSPISGGQPVTASKDAASGPLLGAWWDPNNNGLRTIYGVAGTAYQGAPAFADGSFSGGAACMRQRIALLTTSSGSVYSVALPQGQPLEVSSSGIRNASIVFSPSCTAALVYAPGGSAVLLLQGLLSTPTGTQMNLPAANSAAAIADSGAILIALPAANGTAIQLLAGGASAPQLVTVLGRFGGMTFLPGVDAALFADASANTVIEASHLTSKLSLATLAGATEGISQPTAVAVSADGHLAAVANAGGSSVIRLDLSGKSAPVKTTCQCSPTELLPLAGNFAFRLNEPGSGTVWAFDGNGTSPRVVFIPTDQAANTQAATVQPATTRLGGSR
jgi:hypothetical protein